MKVVSIGMFVPDSQPVIWRGPMFHCALQQFLADAFWDDLGVLLIDMPSSTGDVVIPITQLLLNSQILVITTPQVVIVEVAERAGSITSQAQQRIIGVVENTSYLPQPDGSRPELFGSGGGASISACLSVQLGYEMPLLAQVPLDITLHEGGDVGCFVTLGDDPTSQVLSGLAEKFSIVKRGLSGRPLGASPVQK